MDEFWDDIEIASAPDGYTGKYKLWPPLPDEPNTAMDVPEMPVKHVAAIEMDDLFGLRLWTCRGG